MFARICTSIKVGLSNVEPFVFPLQPRGQLLSKTLADGMPAPGDTDLFLFSYVPAYGVSVACHLLNACLHTEVMHENVEALRSTNFGLLPTLLEASLHISGELGGS